jgi:hypothetical protein
MQQLAPARKIADMYEERGKRGSRKKRKRAVTQLLSLSYKVLINKTNL